MVQNSSAREPRGAAPLVESRRYDPDRRDRIIDACVDVIATVGVAGVSHRKVAEAADVPLGSMTYHFTGMHELLHEAFSRFAEQAADRFDEQMRAATDATSAGQALVRAIVDHPTRAPRTLILTQELYTLAARDPRFRDVTDTWMRRSRAVLGTWFDPVTTRLLDALVEGLTLHRALDLEPPDARPDPYDAETVGAAVARITGDATTGVAPTPATHAHGETS